MYCPLMSARNGFVECQEGKCAWWNDEYGHGQCAIRSIDVSLDNIDRNGIEIYEPEDECDMDEDSLCECDFDEEEH